MFIFGTAIVLSVSACKKFVSPEGDQDDSDNKSLLVRRQIYLEQMRDPKKFEKLYTRPQATRCHCERHTRRPNLEHSSSCVEHSSSFMLSALG
jgi:hypothetical protein